MDRLKKLVQFIANNLPGLSQIRLWSTTLVGLVAIWVTMRLLAPDRSVIFYYTAALYLVDSLCFFSLARLAPKLGRVMIGFLWALTIVALLFYGLIAVLSL